jgi:hypothetical protein
METIKASDILSFIQGGGNVALLFCVFVIWQGGKQLVAVGKEITERLARIEEKLSR